ncbi:hypothetical protein [Roseobacter sp. CCS2]|uniref:hypothetical protein n=1 Tax=Roseobacter sp. CCS2 TaxID=391593 RepID=UPI0000F3C793|nr:hypothetical protein [Roseobacter sp. CCS2]EBA11896.1 hypothetical protein RCCS2_18246 [Roseobacter sp. CCS2]
MDNADDSNEMGPAEQTFRAIAHEFFTQSDATFQTEVDQMAGGDASLRRKLLDARIRYLTNLN